MTDDECGAVGRMIIGMVNGSTRRKPAPITLSPPQIPHDLTRARTRDAAVGTPVTFFFNLHRVGGGVESKLGPHGTAALYCPIVPAPGDCEDGELFGGMKIGRGNRSTRRKPTPAPLCPPQIPLDQTRDRTRPAGDLRQGLTLCKVFRNASLT
jgi:hypothetical protein